MANQPPPMARPLFRLTSLTRPAPAPTPEFQPQPPVPQPRPLPARPTSTMPFRPPTAQTQPTQPQEPAPTPPSVAVAPPRPAVPPPPTATSPSIPTIPIPRTMAPSSSFPTSPAPKASLSSTILPAISSASVPSSPKPEISASSSSLPTSPIPKAAQSFSVPSSPTPRAIATTAATTSATIARVPTPKPSPEIIKPLAQTPPQSTKIKPPTPPPSPLTLPLSQLKLDAEPEPKIPLEAEQKNVLVQKTIEKPKARLNSDLQSDVHDTCKPSINTHNGKREVTKDIEIIKTGNHKMFSDSKEVDRRVITISGENKGAFMELGHSHKKNNPRARNNGNEWGSYSNSSNDEGKPKMMEKSHKEMAMPSSPMSAFMNSNVQGVSNSFLYNSSFTHHDPGVHLALSGKTAPGRGIHLKDHINGHHS